MIVAIRDAVSETCGGKAGALASLWRAGLPVPDGFVVPFAAYRAAVRNRHAASLRGRPGEAGAEHPALDVSADLRDALSRGLDVLDASFVAVRSSAADEDTADESGAGQYESFLAVRGLGEVAAAVGACWASLHAPRAVAYRNGRQHDGSPDRTGVAVLIQRLVDAEVSGVMFTDTGPDGGTQIEASWGLGPSVVGGTVTPDSYRVAGDGSLAQTIADKRTRVDRHDAGVRTHAVPAAERNRPALDDTTAVRLARLGAAVAVELGGAQDIEWALADGRLWVLQARPVTAALPPPSAPAPPSAPSPARPPTPAVNVPTALDGVPGSSGTVTGIARIVRGPGDFARVRPGDILVCPYTDPAWTPLLRRAAGVVTETGGVLSHAAIVAREQHIPAVLGIADATTRITDGVVLTVDGSAGTATTAS